MASLATTMRGWARPATAPADRSHRGAYWQHVVLCRAALARTELLAARRREPALGDVWDHVHDLLASAEDAARRPGSPLRVWFGGCSVNRAFVNLHAALVLLARHVPADRLDGELESAMTRVRDTMPPTAERRKDLERRCRQARAARGPAGVALRRAVLEKALEWSYGTTDAQHARLRSFRNVLSGVSIAVLCLLIGLTVMGVFWKDALKLCFVGKDGPACPTGPVATPRDALVIAVLGAAGGALAAVLTISRMQGTSTPYSVPLALAMLKLPVGALTALLGLLLIHGRFVPGLDDLDSSGQILAYAVILGVAQHAVTALVDRRGQELLAGIPSKRTTGAAPPPERAGRARTSRGG